MDKRMMTPLVNKIIKVDRGGPESRIGKLLAVNDDFFVLYTEEDDLVYYRMQHIKSLTLDTKSDHKFKAEIPDKLKIIRDPLFRTVVGRLVHQWVKVNRGGPEMVEGILDSVSNNYVTVISNEEVLHIAMYHLRNISVGAKDDSDTKQRRNTRKK